DVDRAMRWGFGWELGPFEMWDAIGIDAVIEACAIADPPPMIRDLRASARTEFRDGALPPPAADLLILTAAKHASRIVKTNAAASLIDLGDGVLCVEFHSKMNTIGGDTLQMLRMGVREASQHFAAVVVGNDSANFSAGANLMLVLLEAQEENWDEIDVMVRAFQQSTLA